MGTLPESLPAFVLLKFSLQGLSLYCRLVNVERRSELFGGAIAFFEYRTLQLDTTISGSGDIFYDARHTAFALLSCGLDLLLSFV